MTSTDAVLLDLVKYEWNIEICIFGQDKDISQTSDTVTVHLGTQKRSLQRMFFCKSERIFGNYFEPTMIFLSATLCRRRLLHQYQWL